MRLQPRGQRLSRATWIFLALSAGVYLSGEAGARVAQHFSNFYRRIRLESHAAQALRKAQAGQPESVLVVGNSLLKAGLDFEQLNHDLAPRFHVSRFVVEGSAYYDWYYGLRTVYRRGARPDTVVLCMNAGFLADKTVPDQLSAYLLFDAGTIWTLARDVHEDATTVADWYLAHASALYGSGPELRGVLFGKLVNVPELWDEVLPPILPFSSDPRFVETIEPRLRATRELCEANGSKFLFLIPPMRERGDGEMLAASGLAHVHALRPIPNYSLDASYYLPDMYHLNDKGARVFTAAVIRELPLAIER